MTKLLKWIMILFLLFFISCSGEYDKGWSWGVMTEDGKMSTAKFLWSKHEVRVDDIMLSDPHKKCKEKHYVDPYTKKEYCLPEDFLNIDLLHLYLVEEK